MIASPALQTDPAMRPHLASWGRRLAAYLLDELLALGPLLVALTWTLAVTDWGSSEPGDRLGITLSIAMIAGLVVLGPIWIWNFWVRQGRTGRSLAKGWLGLRVVSADDGQPIGVRRAIGRDLCHTFIDAWAYIGFLWPLWDARRQTFADMIVRTVVVSER